MRAGAALSRAGKGALAEMANPTSRQVVVSDIGVDQNPPPPSSGPGPQPSSAGGSSVPPPEPPTDRVANIRLLRKDLLAVQDVLSRVASGTLSLSDYLDYLRQMYVDIDRQIEQLPSGEETLAETKEVLHITWLAIQNCPLFTDAAQSAADTTRKTGTLARQVRGATEARHQGRGARRT